MSEIGIVKVRKDVVRGKCDAAKANIIAVQQKAQVNGLILYQSWLNRETLSIRIKKFLFGYVQKKYDFLETKTFIDAVIKKDLEDDDIWYPRYSYVSTWRHDILSHINVFSSCFNSDIEEPMEISAEIWHSIVGIANMTEDGVNEAAKVAWVKGTK